MWIVAALTLGTLLSCSQSEPDPAGMKLVFEDQDAGRLAICGPDGGKPDYLTPDSLQARGPVTDSGRTTVYFIAKSRSQPEALAAAFSIHVDGTGLRQLAHLPLSVLDLQITPNGSMLLFLGKYPDQEYVRAYRLSVGDSAFQAVTPDTKSVHDPAMAPGGLNFVWHDGSQSDTLFVSSLQSFLTLPIFPFAYTQVSLSWPHGQSFAAVCGPNRHGLCFNLLQDDKGEEVRRESVLIPESEGLEISQPAFHPDGVRILYVETESADPRPSRLCVIDRNSLKITRIPLECRRPAHPAWVR